MQCSLLKLVKQMLQHHVFDLEVTPISNSGRLPRAVAPNARRRFEAFVLLSPFCDTDIGGDTVFDSQWRLTTPLYGGSGTEIYHLLQFAPKKRDLGHSPPTISHRPGDPARARVTSQVGQTRWILPSSRACSALLHTALALTPGRWA